ncbi:hypothetical protein [Vibrio phage VP4B]|uniref:Uncharacterized protein n=1 Tax=Vibrio phage VP4B TaxID=1262540 RepID=V9LZ90_9CAUD|nr:hypothetical protein FDJ61_gp025 [Vibrio phage VP4B]AGB07139.1 hypothetical protein [Vibrio phage VP4B]
MSSIILYTILVMVLLVVAAGLFRFAMSRLSIVADEYGYTHSVGVTNVLRRFRLYVKYNNGKEHSVYINLVNTDYVISQPYQLDEEGNLVITMKPCDREGIPSIFRNEEVRAHGEAGELFYNMFNRDITALPYQFSCSGVRRMFIEAIATEIVKKQHAHLEYLERKIDRNLSR